MFIRYLTVSLLQMIEQLLKLLDYNGNQLTGEVQAYIDDYLDRA